MGALLFAVVLLSGSALAPAAEPSTAGVRACFALEDAQRRLACYDTEVGKMAGGNTADQFGVDGKLLQKRLKEGIDPQKPQELLARIAEVTRRTNGRVVVRLDNDQVWEQSDDGPDLRIGVGDPVKIARGMLGSYWLSAHSSLAIKVSRTR